MTADRRTLEIADHGRSCRADYVGLMAYHGGGALFGATVAYRALQLAAHALSNCGLWDRKDLTIMSSHAGPGVVDAIEFVTRCVSRDRYVVANSSADCGTGMRFEWQIGDGRRTILLQLREGLVPQRFFELAERTRTGLASADERQELRDLKGSLSARLWKEPLDALFELRWLNGSAEEERACA